MEGHLFASVLARLPGVPGLASARAVCRFWCDASHWFVVAAAAAGVESLDAPLSLEACLGLLRQLDRTCRAAVRDKWGRDDVWSCTEF